MAKSENQGRAVRLLALGLIVGLGAYWAGARYGQHGPASVGAVPAGLPADEQQSIVLAILRREMGVMTAAALVVCFLALRAAGTY